MGREHRVITALRDTAVPVPTTYAVCDDPDVIGAPFYVMERVAGTPYRFAAQLAAARRGAGAGDQRAAWSTRSSRCTRSTRTSVGLGDFGRPEGFLERQVRRWKQQLDASRSRELPGIDELHERLAGSVPAQGDPTIVHGDFRLDNLLVTERRRGVGGARLGDGHARGPAHRRRAARGVPDAPAHDGQRRRLRRLAARRASSAAPSCASGMPRRADATSTTSSFHLGLAYFKLAVILEGIHYRYTQGQTVGSRLRAASARPPARSSPPAWPPSRRADMDFGFDARTEELRQELLGFMDERIVAVAAGLRRAGLGAAATGGRGARRRSCRTSAPRRATSGCGTSSSRASTAPA